MISVKQYLERELVPSLGCTEPVAVALAAARARKELGDKKIDRIDIELSDSIYKNGMGVGIPGANGMTGNDLAAALGAIGGDSDLDMQVLRDITEDDVKAALKLMQDGKVSLACMEGMHGVYIHVVIEAGGSVAECRIEGEHNNITSVSLDGDEVKKAPKVNGEAGQEDDPFIGIRFEELLKLAEELESDDIGLIMDGVLMNRRIAEYGLERKPLSGLGVGAVFNDFIKESRLNEDVLFKIRAYCSAGSDARMAGCTLPVMTVAGSGNQGITSMLSVALLAEALGKNIEDTAKAVMVSMLTTSYVRSAIGRVTPMCGCVVGAGAGAAAGMTYLMGGDISQIKLAMQTILANLAGIVCDGAKGTCALRVGTAVTEAYLSALMAGYSTGSKNIEGISGPTMERTAQNVSMLNKEGMKLVDKVLIDIMEESKQRR
ncbi:MAG TPA: L-serine ammonia-lyase, iron-sulfur-dependent, subunit alpha [Bacillota bacterium]|nr:L-serine ammonia-lyase, iron-sulfur-dependent, subunit alpha [Bacillota bacterium]HOH10015.1 L-serine ammonia-lyase, iron-sulfur-dependent, subunit alpha [Bacillota bacterium]HPI01728.1 L-serine ammonia-lyase, iron-sulfur-dependent, subunit alpha [Bacillota bacterium]HPM63278.1 L-serine ammonia-lyase, iron-sulfur-dependent, subunit alpha [Bacillota bacterium]